MKISGTQPTKFMAIWWDMDMDGYGDDCDQWQNIQDGGRQNGIRLQTYIVTI